MGASIGSRKGVQSNINITPLVDVVLVLLIIFMVVTPLMRAAKLELPVSSSRERAGPPAVVTLSLLANRELRWEQTVISLSELGARARAAGTGAVLTLKADASLPVDAVQPVLDALQRAGASGVRFAVEAPKR